MLGEEVVIVIPLQGHQDALLLLYSILQGHSTWYQDH